MSSECLASERFSATDSDVTFESADSVLFKLHRANLSTHSSIFPVGSEIRSDGEVVKLQEDSEVLEVLFQHVYPGDIPTMDDIPFPLLSRIADAAQKYQITVAMEICRLHMRNHIISHPLGVFAYAVKHGYDSMADQTALRTLDYEPQSVLNATGPVHFAHWVLYRDHWIKVRDSFLLCSELDKSHLDGCHERWRAGRPKAWPVKLAALQDTDAFFAPVLAISTSLCNKCPRWWQDRVARFKSLVEAIPTYTHVARSL
ncbi:unnamed protein product [Peniophora sp. CBMAI 1063]|nr:unnamed protein product [Peniophora sp. CBMAI 1063]